MLGPITSALFAKPKPQAPQTQPQAAAAKPAVVEEASKPQSGAGETSARRAAAPVAAAPSSALLDMAEPPAATAKPSSSPRSSNGLAASGEPAVSTQRAAAPASLLDVADEKGITDARQAALDAQAAMKLESLLTSIDKTASLSTLQPVEGRETAGTDLQTARRAYEEAMATAA